MTPPPTLGANLPTSFKIQLASSFGSGSFPTHSIPCWKRSSLLCPPLAALLHLSCHTFLSVSYLCARKLLEGMTHVGLNSSTLGSIWLGALLIIRIRRYLLSRIFNLILGVNLPAPPTPQIKFGVTCWAMPLLLQGLPARTLCVCWLCIHLQICAHP